MGAWGTGLFDNDNAADFKGSVEDGSDVGARQDILSATMGAILERDIREDEITPEYEHGYEVEFALAAAAFVADARNGRHDFTNTSYAMGHDETKNIDDDDAWYHIEVGTPPEGMVWQAVQVGEKVLERLRSVGVDQEWHEPVEALLKALREYPQTA